MLKMDLRKKNERQTRSDKKTRVNASLDHDTHDKLKKLAISCDMTKTALASEIVKLVLNNLDYVNYMQNKYNKDEQYRIIPVKKDGKIYYS